MPGVSVLAPSVETESVAAVVREARRRGARWIVDGGYQRLGDRLRITARMVDIDTGRVAHTARVDGALDALFALQDELLAGLRQNLALRPVSPSHPVAVPLPTTSMAPERDRASRSALATTEGRGGEEAAVVSPADAASRAPTPAQAGFAVTPAAGLIDGPPPPLPPETVSRDARRRVTIRATPLTGAFRVDGALDEGIYQSTRPVSDFIQQLPDEGAPATEKTESWIFYDQNAVYVGARLWDAAPESEWVANEMQRDSFQIINNDSFSIAFDTFYDRRNGVAFMVNPDRWIL